jgi:hypothetical protein
MDVQGLPPLFSVLASFIARVYKFSRDDSINFYHKDEYQNASWWDIKLIDYNKVGDQALPMQHIYEATS